MMQQIWNNHNHTIITAGIVLLACLLGFGVEALLMLSGFWFGREHSQAEYRYMKKKGINRSKLGFFDGFRKESWDKDSFLNDLMIPICVGLLILGVVGSGRDITVFSEKLLQRNQEDIFKVNEFKSKAMLNE